MAMHPLPHRYRAQARAASSGRVLQHAKRSCLVTNSLTGGCELVPSIRVAASDQPAVQG